MKAIEIPENHALIARNVCGWDWKTFIDVFGTEADGWFEGDVFVTFDETPFGEGIINYRDKAIEAARLRGWYAWVLPHKHGYSVRITGVAKPLVTMIPTKAEAEFAALLFVAKQIEKNENNS